MTYILLTTNTDGEDVVEILHKRPSYVIIENASTMLKIDVEKSHRIDVLTDIKDIAKAIKE